MKAIIDFIKVLFGFEEAVKSYVCGIIFSHDQDCVYLVKKNRPEWQKDLLNGPGGKVEPFEDELEAMIRETSEEIGVDTLLEQWIQLDVFYNEGVKVTFFAARLYPDQVPFTLTDEPLRAIKWKRLGFAGWKAAKVVDNIPYLVAKGYSQLNTPEHTRMALQKVQDNRK